MPLSDRILATKLLAPRTGVKLVGRLRLLAKFENCQARKLTLVSAPAGYGKTVLISQFTSQLQSPVVWYQLDHFDNDLALFVQHLLAGIDRHLPGFALEIMKMVEQNSDLAKEMRRVTTVLVNSLSASLEEEMVLVIDDYHVIEEQSVHAFMEQFLDYLPDKVHLILASRTIPPLHLGRLKVAGLVEEITLADLRFSQDEIAGFLTAEKNEPVSSQTIIYLEKETGGWPAALRLAGISMSQIKARQYAQTGRTQPHRKEIYHYLATEVLNNLPEGLSDFVLFTSVLDILTPEICDLLLERSDSYQELESLEAQNLFITALEGEGEAYRYHHLFREFLQSRLGDKRSGLVQKAGQCYLQAGYPDRAIECFLDAGDFTSAALAVEKVGARMLLHSRWQTVRRWLKSIPQTYKRRPWLLLFEGAVFLNGGQLEQAESLIGEAAVAFDTAADRDGIIQAQLYRARILRTRGDYQESMKLLARILPELSQRPVAQWYDITMEHSLILGMRGELDKAVSLLNQTLKLAEQEGEVSIAAQLAERLGEIYYVKGEYARAVSVHQRATEMAPEQERLSFLHRDSIATIYHDWGDLDQALEYAQSSIKAKEQLGLIEALPYAYQQLALILASMGENAMAEDTFRHSIELTNQLGGEKFFQARSKALYGRFLSSQGRFEEARLLVDEALEIARNQSEFIYAICLQASAPVYIRMGELEAGTSMLEKALAVSEHVGAKYSVCIACAVLSMVYRQTNKELEAKKLAVHCLELAAAENCVQIFLSNPEMMLPVVRIGLVEGLDVEFLCEVIRRLGAEAAEILLELANHACADVRMRIITPLTLIGGDVATAALAKLMMDEDERVRDDALAATQTLSNPEPETNLLDYGVNHTHQFAKSGSLEVQCLGSFRVFNDKKEVAWRTTKARDLFAYLIHHREKPVLKEKFLEELWPDTDPEQSSPLFHTNLYQLRKAAKTSNGEQPVKHKGGQYLLDQSILACDIDKFESLAKLLGAKMQAQAIDAAKLEQAISLYRGEYMEGLDYEWVIAERERLNQIYLSLLDQLAHYYADNGELTKAASCLRALLYANPLLEEAHSLLMTVYAGLGDRMAVLQQYETLSQILEEELGIDPSTKTRELYYKLCSEEA